MQRKRRTERYEKRACSKARRYKIQWRPYRKLTPTFLSFAWGVFLATPIKVNGNHAAKTLCNSLTIYFLVSGKEYYLLRAIYSF